MELLAYLPTYKGHKVNVLPNQNVEDIMAELIAAHKEYAPLYDKISEHFDQTDPVATARYLFAFLKKNVNYKVEPETLQTVKAPQAILAQKHGDCKHYASFINGVLASLKRNHKYPYKLFFRFANYTPDTVIPQHVFSVMEYQGHEYWIDPVLDDFDEKKRYINKVDKKADIMLQRVSGVGCASCSQKIKQRATVGNAPPTGLDDTGAALVASKNPTRNPPWGSWSNQYPYNNSWHWSTWKVPNMYGWWRNINDPAPPAGLDDTGQPLVDSEAPTRNPPWNGGWHWSSFRNQKDAQGNLLYGWYQDWTRTGVSALLHDAGEFVDKAITDVRELYVKGLLVVPRNAFLGLLALNAFGLADLLDKIRTQHQKRLFDMWDHDLGGAVSSLNSAIDTGKKKHPLAGVGDTYVGEISYIGDPVTISGLIAACTPIIAAIATISGSVKDAIKGLGLDKNSSNSNVNQAKQDLIDKVKKSGNFCDASFCYSLDQSGNLIMKPQQKMLADTSGSSNTLLYAGAGAAIIYLLTRK